MVHAFEGADALRQLRTRTPKPALVVLDLMMPGMNGWEFRAEQAKDPELARVPVLVISGDGHVHDKAATLHVDGYIRKPFSAAELLDTVGRLTSA